MNKNKLTLISFVNYCTEHPDERFWQALRSWSKYDFIFGRKMLDFETHIDEDTYYKEDK